MAYVRNHGNQIAIVHGERDPETGEVQQRVLFTIYSKPEALAALGRSGEDWCLEQMLEQHHPRIRFDWEKIRAGIEERMGALPDSYAYKEGELLGRFRGDLCAFTRQLGLADPQITFSAAELVSGHRVELEYLRDLIDWRLKVCEQEPNEWNRDNAFFWRHRLQSGDYPAEIIEKMADLYAARDLDRLEALARLFLDCFDGYVEGHNYLGLVAQERGELEVAVEHFQRAVTEGRKLFPRRFAKRDYWVDHDTRPYMRGLRNQVVALMRLCRHDEALAICERLDQECGDDMAAISFKAHIYLNMGRWADAREAADHVVRIWPDHAYIAAFASLELGERREALGWFLHGVLARPRVGRMLLGLRSSRPEGYRQITDHNSGVEAIQDLEPYLPRLSRSSRSFLKGILGATTTTALLAEAEEVTHRREKDRATEGRDAFDRLRQLESLEFARESAEQVWLEVTA